MKPDNDLIDKISASYEHFILEHFGTASPEMDPETAAQLSHATMIVFAAKLANLVAPSCNKEDYPNIIKIMGVQFEMLLAKFLRHFDEDQVKEKSEGGVH